MPGSVAQGSGYSIWPSPAKTSWSASRPPGRSTRQLAEQRVLLRDLHGDVLHDRDIEATRIEGKRQRTALHEADHLRQPNQLRKPQRDVVEHLAQLDRVDGGAEPVRHAPRRAAHAASNIQHALPFRDLGHQGERIGRGEPTHVDHVHGMQVLGAGALWCDSARPQ
jgi:hypothetical protein